MSDNIPNTLSARQAEHDPNFMLSLARGLEVLNAFTPQRQRLTISQLSQKTQISRAAVRRCLYTLAALGMVHSPDGRHYELLPGCWRWAMPISPAPRWRKWRRRRWTASAKPSANPVRRRHSTGITCSILPARR